MHDSVCHTHPPTPPALSRPLIVSTCFNYLCASELRYCLFHWEIKEKAKQPHTHRLISWTEPGKYAHTCVFTPTIRNVSRERELDVYIERRDRLYHGWQKMERETQQRVGFHYSCVNREIKSDRMTEKDARDVHCRIFRVMAALHADSRTPSLPRLSTQRDINSVCVYVCVYICVCVLAPTVLMLQIPQTVKSHPQHCLHPTHANRQNTHCWIKCRCNHNACAEKFGGNAHRQHVSSIPQVGESHRNSQIIFHPKI